MHAKKKTFNDFIYNCMKKEPNHFRRPAPSTSKDVKPVIKKETAAAASSSTASAAKAKQEEKKVSPVKNQKKTSPAKKGENNFRDLKG